MKAEREKIHAKVKADTVRLNGSKLELTADEEMCTFLLVSEGSCTLQMGENSLLVNPGSALLLGAGLLCGRCCTGLRLCVGSAAAAAKFTSSNSSTKTTVFIAKHRLMVLRASFS